MSGKELWEAFIMENNFVECHYETWAFGVEADLLAHLVATAKKLLPLQLILCTNWKTNLCLQ